MMRYAAPLGMGLVLAFAGVGAPASGQPINVAPPPPRLPPIFVTTLDSRDADMQEQRLEFDRQQADAQARRVEAEDHRRRVDAQTPKGRSSTTTYSGLPVGDPLAGTSAQSCVLSNGVTIQASGGMRNDRCQR